MGLARVRGDLTVEPTMSVDWGAGVAAGQRALAHELTGASRTMLALAREHALDRVQFGPVPVVAALHGAVVGGGLELASACHIRVADETTFYALPEGSRGIFVGGGGAVRIPRLIGTARMTDMMMTGRVYNAVDGERVGFAQYLVPTGTAFDKAFELAQRIAQNAPLTNYALMHALPRIAEQPSDQGLMTEAMMAAIAQSAPEAKARVRAFLDGKAAKVQKA